MYNPFEEEYVNQVQRVRDLRAEGRHDEADLEQNTLDSMNQVFGIEDYQGLDQRTKDQLDQKLEVVYE